MRGFILNVALGLHVILNQPVSIKSNPTSNPINFCTSAIANDKTWLEQGIFVHMCFYLPALEAEMRLAKQSQKQVSVPSAS
jgi:hypothetical protein